MLRTEQRQFLTIRNALAEQIESGLLPSGEKLPSERTLSEVFKTTRITLKEALLVLEAEGKIFREGRKGWFVSPERLAYNPVETFSFHSMVEKQGRVPKTVLLEAASVPADVDMCRRMGVPPLSSVYCIRRQRFIDGRLALYNEQYLRTDVIPEFLEKNLDIPLLELYRQEHGKGYASSSVEIIPTAAMGRVAQAMKIADGSPIVHVVRNNFDGENRVIGCDFAFWRSDAVKIHFAA